MSDTREKKSAEVHTQSRATAGTTAQSASETAQTGGAAAEQAGRGSADALRQGGRAAAQIAQHSGGEASAETMQHFSKIAEDATRRGTQPFADRQQQFMQRMAERLEQTGDEVAEAAQVAAQDVRALMVLPNVVGESLHDLQQGVGGLVKGMIRTNLDAAQELLRLADVGALVRLQQRAVHNYMEALIQGSAILTHSVRTAADRTLGPLEQQLEYRRQGLAESQRHDRRNGRVGDVMHRDARLTNPDDTVQQVARLMRDEDTGALPVGEDDRLVGIVTDRDVALRLVAEGRDPARTKVREVMTPEIRYVFEDEDLGTVAENMAEQQVRRLPVLNRAKRLVGVISLSDLAREGRQPELAGRALGRIAREGGRHTQSAAD
jgi:CBS domain-containing protein